MVMGLIAACIGIQALKGMLIAVFQRSRRYEMRGKTIAEPVHDEALDLLWRIKSAVCAVSLVERKREK